MARQFCALLFAFGFAATTVIVASPDARSIGIPAVRPAAERVAPPAPGQPRASACGKGAVLAPPRPADATARVASAALRVVTRLAQLPEFWIDRGGLDRSWSDELRVAIDELRLSVLEAYDQAYASLRRIGGIGS